MYLYDLSFLRLIISVLPNIQDQPLKLKENGSMKEAEESITAFFFPFFYEMTKKEYNLS